MIREALAALLSFEDDIEVVAQVGRGDEVTRGRAGRQAGRRAARHRDARHGRPHRRRRAARRPARHVKIVILTTFGRPGYLRRAMEAGASGFIVKDSPADKLAQHDPRACSAASGSSTRTWPPPRSPRARARSPRASGTCSPPPRATTARPSPRSPPALYLSEGTVRNYLSACIQKTGARNRDRGPARRPGTRLAVDLSAGIAPVGWTA